MQYHFITENFKNPVVSRIEIKTNEQNPFQVIICEK